MGFILRAAFIAPMDRAIIRDGAIAIDAGKVVAVGAAKDVVTAHADADADVRDLGIVVLLPGLVNAHTHLELSLTDRPARGDASFVEWLNLVRQRENSNPAAAVREGVN